MFDVMSGERDEIEFVAGQEEIDGLSADLGNDKTRGPSRYIDLETALLSMYGRTWNDFQTMRKSMAQRDIDVDIVEDFEKIEQRLNRKLTATLRKHPIWPWLSQYPGLGGAHVARVIAAIGDPRRFPGQRCTVGHYHPPIYEVGSRCPNLVRDVENVEDDGAGEDHADDFLAESEQGLVREMVNGNGDASIDGFVHQNGATAECQNENEIRAGRCPGTMLPPRDTTGVRSVWHYLGLHVDENGRAPRKRKGVQCSWHPQARSSLLMPDSGIAAQIVRLRVPKYRDIYDQAKERIARERGVIATDENGGKLEAAPRLSDENAIAAGANGKADSASEITTAGGLTKNGETAHRPVCAGEGGLRPFQIEQRARIIAVKAFVGDLLVEWKRIVDAEPLAEIEKVTSIPA